MIRKSNYYLTTILFLLFFTTKTLAQNVGISSSSGLPDSSAILDIASTDKGLLIPRMDSISRMNIVSPAEGLMVFDSTYNRFYVYDGMIWSAFSGLSDNMGNHFATQNLQLNNNWLNNDGEANEGIAINDAGQIGIGAEPAGNLRVSMGTEVVEVISQTYITDYSTESFCQTFTITENGELHSIELLANSSGSVIYNLYEGNGTGGTLLAGPLNQANTQDPYLFSGVSVTQGQVITLEIQNGSIGYAYSDENIYTGGGWCSTSFVDYWFKINLQVQKSGFRITDNEVQINDYSLPATDGTAGQSLSTNGAGTTTWIPVTNSDHQDLNLVGNTLSVTNDPSAVNLTDYLDNTDYQNLDLSGNTLSLSNDTTTVDLSAYMDNTDAQNLSLSGDTLSLSNDTTIVDLSIYLDNTDAQELSLSNDTLSLSNDTTTIDLTGYLDNIDAQDLTLSGRTLSLSNDASNVDLDTLFGADLLGNHTATQNVQLNNNWLNKDGDANEGLNINNNGQVGINISPSADFHVDMGTGGNITPINISDNGTTLSSFFIAQSFTAPVDGELVSVTTALSNTAGTTTYRILMGELGGEIIQSGTLNCVDGNNTFDFSGVTLVKNQIYTFTLAFPLTTAHTYNLNSTNPYAGGAASNDVSHDLAMSMTMFIPSQGFKVESTGVTVSQYTLPVVDGVNSEVLVSDGCGNVNWNPIPGSIADNLGNHIASQNLQLNNNWLSNDGDNEGIKVDNLGRVGVGRAVGTVGAAKLELYGPSYSYDGPHIQAVSSQDNLPMFQQLNWSHDNIAFSFDAYFNNGTWRSSNSFSNYSIYKLGDRLTNFVSAVTPTGNQIAWSTGTSLDTLGRFGIGRYAMTNLLEVEGEASKATAGSWLANSDARLKKNIKVLSADEMLDNLLSLQGVSYEWNDHQTGNQRPEGIQYGFTAQNIQEVFPDLVTEDNLGFLQTPYGTYDAMTVEALRALNEKVRELEMDKANLQFQLSGLRSKNQQLKSEAAALAELEASFAALKSKLTESLSSAEAVPTMESKK